ncbi:alanine racemase C-terminal domain-containing protein, partial [Neisseria sp. P0001.S009]|uniref:alanine racemase C-terminal domain-containing protein n=1 Tax=Neisseria sp. P0001.S009 TaxID=3436653 RepID=UPI003F7E39B4
IGYGATFYTSKSTRVGWMACGYADGYPRRDSTNSPVAVDGKRSRIIGRVSRDMITVELEASNEGLGADVELGGDVMNINEVSEV